MRKFILATVLGLAASTMAHAQVSEPFVASDIRVEGLRRIAPGTVFNYLPMDVDDRIDQQQAAEAIRALYQTGFFQDVSLERDGDVLVVNVVERPAIARVEIFGNDNIPSDPLNEALRDIGLSEGETFNRSLLDNLERELERQYFGRGHYNVSISSTVSPLARNRVGIRIDIDEGDIARIREINFVGNDSFSDRELNRLFDLGPKPWYVPFSRRDRYSRENLGGDLENLRSHYLNRGYADFSISSTQVALTPDRSGIYITVNISEGPQYDIGEVRLAGDYIVSEAELRELIDIEEGQVFSDADITAGTSAVRDRLGVEGYAFANVNAVPEVDRENRRVDLTYFVDPGQRAYVRRINISGNFRTDDEVIRREIRQMEGGWYSSERVELSRTRLNRLGFFDRVDVETPQVPGESDQVDVNFAVEEGLSGSLQAGIGYGSGQGVLLNFSVAQDNVLGTGDRAVIAANNSRFATLYQLTYAERYYTVDGVSRSFSALYRETDFARQRLSDFNLRVGALQVGFGVPLNEEDEVRVDFGIEDVGLRIRDDDDTPQRLRDFEDEFGNNFFNYTVGLSWNRITTDRMIFPTRGGSQTLGAEATVPGSDLQYYKLNYRNRRFLPITETSSLSLLGRVSYGEGYGNTSELPFFENYFTGGIGSVRGYRISSLGLRYPENDRPAGGNFRLNASIEYFFMLPFMDTPSVRFSTFVDGGQVYDLRDDSSVDFNEVRYSAGVGFTWNSPLGALTMSWANPLNNKSGDDIDRFQFTLGSFF